jgi:hypothetical protein
MERTAPVIAIVDDEREEHKANAALLTAAPDTLRQRDELLEAAINLGVTLYPTHEDDPELRPLLDALRAAIANAKEG